MSAPATPHTDTCNTRCHAVYVSQLAAVAKLIEQAAKEIERK